MEIASSINRNGAITSATFDNDDRMLTQGDPDFPHRPRRSPRKENIVTGQKITLTYDQRGQLTRAVLNGARTISYGIDGEGHRLTRTVDGVLQTGYLHDVSSRLIAEVEPSGQLRSHFVYASQGHSPDYMIRGAHLYYFAKDNLGSVKAVIDASSGAIAQAIHYDEFGRVLVNTNPGFQPFGFAGGHFDHETGLVRFGARDYDPEVGRWTARDPILFDGGQGNGYSYVGNDSVNMIDPQGTFGWIAAGAAIGALINVYDTVKCGGSARQIVTSALVGAATGALGAISANYGVIAAAAGGFASGLSNSTAQQIINSPRQESFRGALAAGLVEGIAGATGTALTNLANRIFTKSVSEAAGFVSGTTLSSVASVSGNSCGCGTK
ncbi:MAG: RHS repeat-associated core domain-containing protein [Bdellovibrionales bacterium]|nr:RHS repeat-associated core domain-containing protein [Bdellovibrionales bacterium]